MTLHSDAVQILIFTIIKTIDMNIVLRIDLYDSKTIIIGQFPFYHPFHCPIVDIITETVMSGMMMSLKYSKYISICLQQRNDFVRITYTKRLANIRKTIQ